ncbi:hypothetical protein LUZ60_014008 [Juncus effusus]|nr:hypothetical protein LUZ60_014008 [Juncus effusus]
MDCNSASKECDDLLRAQAELWVQIFSYFKSMTLKCAVELRIPDVIRNHGQPITLTELHSALSLPASKKPYLSRVLRVLTQSGIFAMQNSVEGKEAVYDLTPISCLLLKEGGPFCLLPYAQISFDDVFIKPTMNLSDWFKQEELEPFEMAHGYKLWEMTSRNPEVNELFNDSMSCDSRFMMDIVVKKHKDIFQGITSLVDVGGGIGSSAMAIAKAFPHVKCTVLDLPQVVGQLPTNGIVKFVTGDMFTYIPPANVVLLKWILHDWNDEDCVRILRRCKEAIPSREAGGKVIIIDVVIGSISDKTFIEPQLSFDMVMLTAASGTERDENEWRKIIKEAGFTGLYANGLSGGGDWRTISLSWEEFPSLFSYSEYKHISVEEAGRGETWDLGFSDNLSNRAEFELQQLEISLQEHVFTNQEDHLSILGRRESKFPISKVYKLMSNRGVKEVDIARVWKVRLPAKLKVFMWMVLQNKILTGENWSRRGGDGPYNCVCCNQQPLETVDRSGTSGWHGLAGAFG